MSKPKGIEILKIEKAEQNLQEKQQSKNGKTKNIDRRTRRQKTREKTREKTRKRLEKLNIEIEKIENHEYLEIAIDMVREKIELYKVIEVRMEKLEKLELEILGEKTIKTRKD